MSSLYAQIAMFSKSFDAIVSKFGAQQSVTLVWSAICVKLSQCDSVTVDCKLFDDGLSLFIPIIPCDDHF